MVLRRILVLMTMTCVFSTWIIQADSSISAAETQEEKKEKRKQLLLKKLEEAKKAEEAKKSDNSKGDYTAKPGTPAPAAPVVPSKALDTTGLAKLVDDQINHSLATAKIAPSEKTSDADFLRRVYLDLAGKIPTLEQTKAFLDSKDPSKRTKLIDELLASKRYGQRQSDIWVGMMKPIESDNRFVDKEPLEKFLSESFNANLGWDKMVKKIITATGHQDEHGEVTYFMANRGVDKITDSVCKLFLGIQLQCAQCHNHPFTGWKQTEYWGMAQFFYKVNAVVVNPKKGETKNDQVSETNKVNRKLNPLPESAKSVTPKLLGGSEVSLSSNEPYRPVLAEWLVSPKNPWFAKAMVNRTWAMLMGHGIVNPVDDMMPENLPTHPELLDKLTGEFIASGFDLKHLIRGICNSEAYQRTSKPTPQNKSDERFYSHMNLKTLTAEQLYDSIVEALGSEAGSMDKQKGQNKGGPMTQRDQFVRFFATGEDVKPTEYDSGIPQVLRLMNASRYNTSPALARELAKAKPEEAIEKIFLKILSRRPTENEIKRLKEVVTKEGDKAYSDIVWVLMNSSEFALNR
jgi:hypothetical protein